MAAIMAPAMAQVRAEESTLELAAMRKKSN
jgi:hypothetical protein